MVSLIGALLNGICMGSVYGLIALGLSLLYGVTKIINFAHGQYMMLALFLLFWLWSLLGIHPYLGLTLVVPAMFALGYWSQKRLVNPILRREVERSPLSVLLLTVGLGLFIENAALLSFGPNYRVVTVGISEATVSLFDARVPLPRLLAFLVAIAATYATWVILATTELGRNVRATAQDREAAQLMGIDNYETYAIAFGIACVAIGLAATMLSPFYYVFPTMGALFGLRSWVIIVLGGVGSIPGSLIGGLVVGLIESLGAQFMTATITEGIIFFLFISVLLLRPWGLFGRPGEE